MFRASLLVAVIACLFAGCSLIVDFDRSPLQDGSVDGSLDGAAEPSTSGPADVQDGAGGAGGDAVSSEAR